MDLLDRMATLVRVVEAGTLSKAAHQLRRSTASVSRQLTALEALVGTQLLVRSTRRITVTEAGRAYYHRAIGILAAVEDAHAAVPGPRVARGLLRVSVPVTFGLARVCPLLPALLKKHQGLEIDLRLEDRRVDLVSDGVDLAVAIGAAPPAGGAVVAVRIGAYRRYVVAAPSYLSRAPAPAEPEGLASHSALLQVTSDGPSRVWRFKGDGRETSATVRGPLATNVVYALRDASIAGIGVALLPEWLVQGDVEAGRLRRLLPEWSNEVSVFALYREELRGAARLRAFVDSLREAWSADAGG